MNIPIFYPLMSTCLLRGMAILVITTSYPAYGGTVYWLIFNIEEETAQGARIVTYATLSDMLNDENRTSVIAPDGGFVPENVVGSGSDGKTYWNVFNIEQETAQGARIVTYNTLNDMLNDENRTSVIAPDGGFVPENVVGSGSDGKTYWNVFNIENENALDARIVTYDTLNDMLNDENRTSVIAPDGGFVPENVVGAGASVIDDELCYPIMGRSGIAVICL